MIEIKYNGKQYNIVERYFKHGHEIWQKWEVAKTDTFKEEEKFVWFPLFKNGKFAWLRKYKLKYRLYFVNDVFKNDGFLPKYEVENIIY